MATASETRAPRRSRWTLARRLSVLFFIVLTLVVGAFGALAYHGVREAATARSSERLASVARELAAFVSRSVAVRHLSMRLLARDSTLVDALSAASVVSEESLARGSDAIGARSVSVATLDTHREALEALLAQRSPPTDSALVGWYVVRTDGARLLGVPLAARDSMELATVITAVLRSDSVVHSALYESEAQIRLLVAAPVTRDGQPLGVIAMRRRVMGSDSIEGVVKRLSGQNASVAYTSSGSDEWSSVRGQRIPSPLGDHALSALPDTGAVRLDVGDDAQYVASASVSGAPWRIVLTESEASILARPHALLRELLLIAAAVLLLGTLGAYWLSRLETRPLTALRGAADAMARGDYTQTVTPTGAEETVALAEAFNTMSERIGRAHTTLAAQNEALLRANEAKARFLAVMSHELRTPLNAIGGYADLIALGVHGPITDAQRVALERIGRSKDQLVHLVSDILSYARLEATPLQLTRETVSVSAQFESVRDTVAAQFTRKGVGLVITPTEAELCADPMRVQQILINLVINALQFTDAGGLVQLYAEESESMTMMCVRDTGVGIAPEMHTTIFDAFVQVDNTLTRRAGGAGLGLSIVRQLATAMGGDVRVESTPGGGSTFAVSLPRANDDAFMPDTPRSALVSATP